MKDSDLIKEIEEKNYQAFDTLYKKYVRIFFLWVYHKTRDSEISKDILQNFWIYVWLHPKSIKTDEKNDARKFLFKLLSFKLLDYFKSSEGKSISKNSDKLENYENLIALESGETDLRISDFYSEIRYILGALSFTKRRIFYLRVIKNYSVKETAEKLFMKEETIRVRLSETLTYVRSEIRKIF